MYNLLFSCFFVPYLWFIYQKWLHYYCLASRRAVRLFQLNADDEVSVENKSGEKIEVRILDVLRVEVFSNVLLIVYFQKQPNPIDERISILGVSKIDQIRQYLWRKWQSIRHGVSDFLGLRRRVFIVSERSLGESSFRELVRRICATG